MPTPNPNISAVKPNSLFMVSAAKPTLTRSKKAMRKHRIRNGMRRHAALRDARRAALSETFKSAVFIQKPTWSGCVDVFRCRPFADVERDVFETELLPADGTLAARCPHIST